MTEYRLEYAPNARAKCKGPEPCLGVIFKGELRVGTMLRAYTGTLWRHWRCVKPRTIENMKKLFKEAPELNGYEDLRPDDQAKVIKAWRDGQVARGVPDSLVNPADGGGEENREVKRTPAKRRADESDSEAAGKRKKFKTTEKVTNESEDEAAEEEAEEGQPQNTKDGLPPASDVVFIDSLHVSANIGPDCWDRDRPQPIDISVYLHLKESYLDRAGESDNVSDSVDYSALTKKISSFIKANSESETPGFGSADELTNAVTEQAFDLAGEVATAVRVIIGVPKMILLAAGFSVDTTTMNGQSKCITTKQVFIKDLVLPVVIGVNPAERKSKQRVKVNIIFHENPSSSAPPSDVVNYHRVVTQLCQEMESSSYLTLETFVIQIVKTSCMCSDRIKAVTARAQKPSALSFAESSGVEITRMRDTFVR